MKFNETLAEILDANPTSIKVKVPPGISDGLLTVTISDYTSNAVNYTVASQTVGMQLMAGGVFTMGYDPCIMPWPVADCPDIDPLAHEHFPPHQVTISPFYISAREVTQGEFESVMGYNHSYFQTNNGYIEDPDRPVESVTFYDAILFCNNLSKQEGLDTVYTYDENTGTYEYPVLVNIQFDFSKNGYRLPTEAEWEYAYRAGGPANQSRYWGEWPFDSDPVVLENWEILCESYMWYSGNSVDRTHTVGFKLPNDFGLYDMSGNVAEWVNDINGYYTADPQVNPIEPGLPGTNENRRIVRGGNWMGLSGPSVYTTAHRRGFSYNITTSAYSILGFRIAKNQ